MQVALQQLNNAAPNKGYRIKDEHLNNARDGGSSEPQAGRFGGRIHVGGECTRRKSNCFAWRSSQC